MTIYSMTGYGKGIANGENFSITTEIKTVNNRFRDLRFKMSSLFNAKEMELKKILETEFKRGSFDIYINYQKNGTETAFNHLDERKVNDYLAKMIKLAGAHGLKLEFKPTEFLRQEFYLERDDNTEKELFLLLDQSFSLAVSELKKSRLEEGKKLSQVIESSLKEYERFYLTVKDSRSQYQEMVREKLLKRFKEEFKDNKIDENRFLQEVIYYLEKLDIDEEISRIEIHLGKLRHLIKNGGEAGKQLDFLLQELGRETNTVGSKAQKIEISESVVQMKVQLEKIREQSLNIE